MHSTFWPNRIFERQIFKIVTLAWNSRQNWKTVRFPWKLYKTLFSGHAQHVLAKSHFSASKFSKSWNWPQILFKAEKQCAFQVMCISSKQKNSAHFWASKFLKSSHLPEILFKSGKQCVFHENCIPRSFQVMRSRFWPNRILERQSSQNRHAGLKFSRKRENSAPSMKIVQDSLFRSCVFLQNRKTVRFPRIFFTKPAFQVMRSTSWPNLIFERQSSQNRETGLKFSPKLENSALSMKIVQNALFMSCVFLQNRKTVRFPRIFFTKPAFQVMRSTSWPNLIFERQSSQNRETGLKFSPKLENSALSMKNVQNALFRSCAARFGQIAFYSVKVSNILKLASNSLQIGKRVRFSGHVHFFKTKKTVRIFERQRS